MRADSANLLRARLAEYGLEIRASLTLERLQENQPQLAMIAHHRGAAKHLVRYTPTMTVSSLTADEREYDAPDPLLILGPKVTERSTDIFRRLGVNYLDQAGFAYSLEVGVVCRRKS